MFIFGGYNGERGMHFKDVFKFDPGKSVIELISLCISKVHIKQ